MEAQPWLNAGQQQPWSRAPLLGRVRFEALQRAQARYRDIVAAGGWPVVNTSTRSDALRRRLALSGDLSEWNRRPGVGRETLELTTGLARFQGRHGLSTTGRLDAATLEAMNVSAERRLSQIRASIDRIKRSTPSLRNVPRYVVVNIPAFELEAVEAQHVVRRHRVIVGRPTRQTPEVEAQIKALNLYPYWHVPESIVRRDLIPQVRKDPNYLAKHQIRVLKAWQGDEIPLHAVNWRSPAVAQLKFRQDPGPGNALGVVRLDMPNKHRVYLHDTPMKALFRQRRRAFSAGCVRVEDAVGLASWALGRASQQEGVRLEDLLARKEQLEVPLAQPVPVRFVHLTAWASPDGRVSFRPDIYGRDRPSGFADSDVKPRSKRRFDISP